MDRNWGATICFLSLINANGAAQCLNLADGSAGPRQRTELAVHFYNYAAVPEDTLRAAQDRADLSFRAAKIAIVWAECPISEKDAERVTCPFLKDRPFVTLRLVPQSMAAVDSHRAGELGVATYPGAWVFVDNIRHFSNQQLTPQAFVLGDVMAHEIGHLLLGPGSHSHTGIMRTNALDDDWKNTDRY